MTVDKNTIIGDILDFDETTVQYFFEIGMHCLDALLLVEKLSNRLVRFTERTLMRL